YAELVHLPAITGLYAALAAAIGYALFSSSRHVIAGPDAAIGLLAGSTVLPLSGGDPARIVVLAAILGILSGVVLLLAAWLKLGVIADLLSRPVLIGYLNGASLVLIAPQLGKMIPASRPKAGSSSGSVRNCSGKLFKTQSADLHPQALVRAAGRINCWLPRMPGALRQSAVAIVATFAFRPRQPRNCADRRSSFWRAASDDSLTFLWADVAALAPAASGDRLHSFFRRYSSGADLCREKRIRVDPNRELVALGWRTYWPGSGRVSVSASQSRTLDRRPVV
ncbi:MAG: sulfate transporter, partial [Sulfuritalea sp.]|nr:sulfate transporter [Sulfuritalea sp.]